MLPRKHRLTQDKDVTRVLRQGRAVFTNLIAVKAVANKLDVVRTAVVVSTKVDKRSTKRNLIKRRVRSVLSALIPKIKIPVDIVITAKNEALDRDQASLGAALEYCLKKLGLVA
jgi:ribonuclease P protein component